MKNWALLGNWSFITGKPKGLSIYSYDAESGKLEFQETVLEDLYAGQQFFDRNRNIDYVVNEIGNRRGGIGGGGYVVALHLDREQGKVTLINEKESLAPEPSYLCLDKTGRYLIVVHHIDSGHVTKINKVNGAYMSETLFDDAAVVLFYINDDGSLGDACDVHIVNRSDKNGLPVIPHLHSVKPDPTGELYVVCDKGLDRIYTFKINREKQKLVLVNVTFADEKSSPRYLTFHPALPLLYVNYEHSLKVSAYSYNTSEGILDLVDETPLLIDGQSASNAERVEASDILMSGDGRRLYVSVRGMNLISVLDVEEGKLKVIQNIGCDGDPRGLTMAPDGRFLFTCNMMSGTISTFVVAEDGTLIFCDSDTKGVSPANMVII
ncbi:MAG: lactonase family protein [Clostridium sp.]|nr:lactonase family protein [Clostridium sp.]